MSDYFNSEVIDSYKEHEAFHQSFHSDCSTCYSERRKINAWRTVNNVKMKEELGIDNDSKLQPRDGSTPWDKNPLE